MLVGLLVSIALPIRYTDTTKIMIPQQSHSSTARICFIAPPLIVTKEELDLGLAAPDEHLGIADALVEA